MFYILKEKRKKKVPKEFCKNEKRTFINVQNGLLQNSFE
jgi:hypothetical protein